MRVIAFILFILVFGVFSLSGQSSTSYDVEFSRICLIDSIAPDTLTQFWRFTQANNPGGITRDYTYDLAGGYNVAGTVVPCCSCLTAASDKATVEIPGAPGNNWGAVGFLAFLGLVVFAFIFLLYLVETKAARFACTFFFLTLIPVSQGFAQSETLYDVEFTQICLIDSIAPDTIVQFWRFTHANNPGGITRDFTYDLSGAYIPTGTVIGCNDYYLGDNPEGSGTAGTLAIWTGTETLGNSSLTESAQEAAWDLTGSLTVPSGTDAQVPVWGAGKFRYNTTGGGFQGGPSGYYLPWSASPNWGVGYIPRSDGNSLVASGTVRFESNTLYVGSNLRIMPASGTAVSIGSSSTNNQYAGVAIGLGATFTGSDGVAIGYNASSAGTGQSFGRQCTTVSGGVGVGNDADATGAGGVAVGNNVDAAALAVCIGNNNSSATYKSIAIGTNAATTGGSTEDAISIGTDSRVTQREGIAIGDGPVTAGIGGISIGKNAYVTQPASIAFGNGSTTTAENELIIGSIDTLGTERGGFAVSNIYFGTGKNRRWFNQTSVGNGGSYTINGSGAYGTNYTGGNVTIAGGKGTGTGTPGDVIFSTSDAGASGSTLQTLAQRVWVKGETGQLSVGTGSPDASALVQVESTTQGFLPPRMTTTERDAIASPAAGLVIFNTTTTKLECYDGTTWQAAW